MRFGVNCWVWSAPVTTDELRRLAPKVREMGFDWIEIPLENVDDLDHSEGARIVADNGLGVSACVAMGPDRDLIHPEKAVRDNGIAYVKAAIEAAQKLGVTNLIGPVYSATGRTWQQTEEERAKDLDLLEANLKELAAHAGDHGVVLCMEPLNRFETSFINLADQAIEIIDRVGDPHCQIMLDTFHMNIEEKNLGDAIRTVGPRLKHFHACENDRGAPGSGNVRWDDVAAGLKDVGYDGPVVIESFTSKVKTIARAAAVWRSVAPTQDDLALDGLKFLKGLLA